MKVCHFCTTTVDAPYFRNMASGLAGAGISVCCANLVRAPAPDWIGEVPGVSYLSLDADARLRYPGAVLRLARFLRRERIDVLQSHLFDAGVVAVLAARLARTRLLIVTRHHTDQVVLMGTPVHVYLDRWMARAADGVVAVSHAVRDHLVSKDSVDSTPIEVIQLGFDFERLNASEEDRLRVRDEFRLDDAFVIGCVAHLYEMKGQGNLVAALARLTEQIPNVRLFLVGGGDRSALEAKAKELAVEERVVFAGHRRDVPACLGAMDVVVHPSLSEAFSQVVVEAMAAGKPLVSTDVGGAREVIEDGANALLIPPSDVAAIVAAVVRLHGDETLRRRLGEAARESVTRRFTVERMVNHQIECYRRWLDAFDERASRPVS